MTTLVGSAFVAMSRSSIGGWTPLNAAKTHAIVRSHPLSAASILAAEATLHIPDIADGNLRVTDRTPIEIDLWEFAMTPDRQPIGTVEVWHSSARTIDSHRSSLHVITGRHGF